MGGGKYDYASEYGKYKADEVSDAGFEKYVDSQVDLKDAWSKIQSKPEGEQGSYWIPRGATSKAAFGRAHAAEDQALSTGTYRGATDVDPYTGGTRFSNWESGTGDNAATAGGWAAARGGGAPGSDMYPMGLVDYTAPDAMTGVSSELQPWLQPDNIPDSLWNYQPPTLNEWEVQRDWDWAQKPASEYGPQDIVAAAIAAATQAPEGGEGNEDVLGADIFGLRDAFITANDPTGATKTAGNPFGLSVDVGE